MTDDMITMGELISPRIIVLQREIERGNDDALTSFWAQVREEGTLLIEQVGDDPTHSLVTFLWWADTDTENVALTGWVAGFPNDFAAHQLERLADSQLFYRTYHFRKDLRASYHFAPNAPLVHIADWSPDAIRQRQAFLADPEALKSDPFNRRYAMEALRPFMEPDGEPQRLSVLELPAAVPQPWATPRKGVRTGCVNEHRFRSAILDNERSIWVYTSPGYRPLNEAYHLLIVFDGGLYLKVMGANHILDNLLAEGRIPPLVAVFIDAAETQRNVELACQNEPHHVPSYPSMRLLNR